MQPPPLMAELSSLGNSHQEANSHVRELPRSIHSLHWRVLQFNAPPYGRAFAVLVREIEIS